MTNIYFPDEEISRNDIFFVCYMIERVARRLHQRNRYVVNQIGRKSLEHLVSVANVLHAENPLAVEKDWIETYQLSEGTFHVDRVDPELVIKIPGPLQMGKVYERLIHDTMKPGESEVDGIIRVYNHEICDVIDNYNCRIRVYNHEICDVIDNYNCSAYYEPSYVIARAYYEGGF